MKCPRCWVESLKSVIWGLRSKGRNLRAGGGRGGAWRLAARLRASVGVRARAARVEMLARARSGGVGRVRRSARAVAATATAHRQAAVVLAPGVGARRSPPSRLLHQAAQWLARMTNVSLSSLPHAHTGSSPLFRSPAGWGCWGLVWEVRLPATRQSWGIVIDSPGSSVVAFLYRGRQCGFNTKHQSTKATLRIMHTQVFRTLTWPHY